MILEHIFDYSFDPQTNVVDVLVHRLRSKVDKDFPANDPHHPRSRLCPPACLNVLRRSFGVRLSLWYAVIFTLERGDSLRASPIICCWLQRCNARTAKCSKPG